MMVFLFAMKCEDKMSGKSYHDLPLCHGDLSADHKSRLDELLKNLTAFLNTPGDWGYDTKLGRMTAILKDLRAEVLLHPDA